MRLLKVIVSKWRIWWALPMTRRYTPNEVTQTRQRAKTLAVGVGPTPAKVRPRMRWPHFARSERSGDQRWGATHGRTDLWSGEGANYRGWLTSRTRDRRTIALSAVVWSAFFAGLGIGAALGIGYTYSNDVEGIGRLVNKIRLLVVEVVAYLFNLWAIL